MSDSPTAPQPSTRGVATGILALSCVGSSWFLMQIIHECGHVLGAIATGGQVRRVVLVPWEFSRTDLLHNPNPLVTCWSGPIFGAAFPVAIWLVALRTGWQMAFMLRFLAGFCLIANGAYIGVGTLTHDGDGGDLLREGSPGWTLLLFATVTVPCGLFVWHGLGEEFGIGHGARTVDLRTATASLLILIVIVVAESLCAGF